MKDGELATRLLNAYYDGSFGGEKLTQDQWISRHPREYREWLRLAKFVKELQKEGLL